MIVIIFILSLIGVSVAFTLPEWEDLMLIAGPLAFASLFLFLRTRVRRAREAAQKWVILDGSNIMHWKDGKPRIETVREVVNHLATHGFTPGVVFDANAGYLTFGRYLHDSSFGKALGLPEERVMVVPKGAPADPAILAAARDLGAQIVTNDRFRDWAGDYPEIREPGLLVKGGFQAGQLWLNLDAATG